MLIRGPGESLCQVLQCRCDRSMILVLLLLPRLRRDGLEKRHLSVFLRR